METMMAYDQMTADLLGRVVKLTEEVQALRKDAERWRKLRDMPATSAAPGPLRGWLFMRPGDAYSLDRMADALPPLVLPNVF